MTVRRRPKKGMEKQPMDYDKKQESVKNIIVKKGVSEKAALIYIDMAMHSHKGKFLASARTLSRRHNRPYEKIAEIMNVLVKHDLIEYRLDKASKEGDNEYFVTFKE